MYPGIKYGNFERFIGVSKALLLALDRIVPAAEIIAQGRKLTSGQRSQLDLDCDLMRSVKNRFNGRDGLFQKVSGEHSPEALFVRSAIGGGINNTLSTFIVFDQSRDQPGSAQLVERRLLHPYHRLYDDIRRFHEDDVYTGADITIDGDRTEKVAAYYKKTPLPADMALVSEVVYSLVFSALLLSGGEREFSLDFTMQSAGDKALIVIENRDEVFAEHIQGMIGRPRTMPSFLESAFKAGMNVHDTGILVPFDVA